MKRNIYIYSDPHFGHENIIKYCNRPFANAQEMDAALIRNYNQYVRDQDIVFILGDIGCGNREYIKSVIKSLKGIKTLVIGNHDKWGIMSYYEMGFQAVLTEAIITRGDFKLKLRHYPVRTVTELVRLFWLYFKQMKSQKRTFTQVLQRLKREWSRYKDPYSGLVLHGHVHQAFLTRGNNINCSIEMWNYKPINIDQIINLISRGGVI